MYNNFQKYLQEEIQGIKDAGLYKNERVIITPQSSAIKTAEAGDVLNFCANNYLGLADSKILIEAAKKAMDERGYGMSSVRFICGTGDLHKELERKISEFFGTEDTILYAACFDANGGVFEPLLGPEDAIISDALNHAYRRSKTLQGTTLPLCQCRHGRLGKTTSRRTKVPFPFDLYRRSVLNGRKCRTIGQDI